MARSNRQLKTTRLFSLQLADHDGSFSPRQKRHLSFHWLRLLLYLPAAAAFLFPSFKLGRPVLRDPGFQIPVAVVRGEVFTIPAKKDEDIVPQVGGRSLGYVDTKEPFYLGAAVGDSGFELNMAFHDVVSPPWKRIFVNLQHPTYPLFVQHVHVKPPEPAPTPPLTKTKGRGPVIAEERKLPPPIGPQEAKILTRFDGNVRLRCWKTPMIEPLGVDPLKPRRQGRLGSVPAAGRGEVVFTTRSEPEGTWIALVYHGGGLFTRYWGLKELRAQKDMKIATGQAIGNVLLTSARSNSEAPSPANWQPLLNVGGKTSAINPESVLALSSQLCDSK